MTPDATFRMLFWVLFGGVLVMRVYFLRRVKQTGGRIMPDQQAIEHEGRGLFAFRFASWLLMVGILVSYVLNLTWLDTFRVAFPDWLRWLGFVLGVVSSLFWTWVQVVLGREFSVQLRLREAHHLVTAGPYAHIRHPMYTGIVGFGAALALVSANGVFAVLAAIVIIGLVLRIPKEEQMLLEEFGADYRAYMQRTGRLFPK